jgi:hypothetical protein
VQSLKFVSVWIAMEEDAVFAEIEALERQGEERRRKRRRQSHWQENVERDAPKREAFQVPDEDLAAAQELVVQRPAEAANLPLDLQVLRRLLNGTFYTTLDESWGVKTVPCRPRHFFNLRRERMPDFRHPYLLASYTATRDARFVSTLTWRDATEQLVPRLQTVMKSGPGMFLGLLTK